MEEFVKQSGINTRWERIGYIDIQQKKLETKLDPKVLSRIKRKQHSNREYIDKQFKEPAILHLGDGTALRILKKG